MLAMLESLELVAGHAESQGGKTGLRTASVTAYHQKGEAGTFSEDSLVIEPF